MRIVQFGVVAALAVTTFSAAWAGDFDGKWAGQGVVQGANARHGTCATPPSMEMMVKNNVAQGKAALSSGSKGFRWPIKPDGSVDTDDMKGKFDGKEFHGAWTMPTQAGSCAFGVNMKKQG